MVLSQEKPGRSECPVLGLVVEPQAVAVKSTQLLVVQVLVQAMRFPRQAHGELDSSAAVGAQCPHHSCRLPRRLQLLMRTSKADLSVSWVKARVSCRSAPHPLYLSEQLYVMLPRLVMVI